MPEFPLSRPDLKQTEEPRENRGRSGMDFEGARHWRLVQVSYYANLQPSQIVREMDAPDRGWDPSPATGDEHAPRSERQDATADADRQRENTSLVTVDERRYVVDPIVDGHTFTGLWTGGPILHVVSQGRKVLRQTLTRTWCAGHGYTVAKDGAYVAEWPATFDASTGEPTSWTEITPEGYGDVHGTSGNKDKEHSDAPPVREYRTAKDCLKACRPWMEGRLSPYMAFRTDIPASYTREVYWREFTHESIEPLEELGNDVEKLKEVVGYHFGQKVGGTVMDAHTRLDPQTNTVIFVCNLLYRDLKEIKTLDDLIDAPCIDAPCTRDTLRMFGWGQFRNGEGYEYTHVFRWPCLKDSDDTRRVLEFLKDNGEVGTSPDTSTFLLKLLDKHYHPQLSQGATKPAGWWAEYETTKSVVLESLQSGSGYSTQLDNTDRLVTSEDVGPVTSGTAATASVQHYRIAKQKVDIEQDGSLTFTIAVVKSEWHGYDSRTDYEIGGTRQLASIQNPGAWGESEHRVIPSIPRENAIATMNAISAGSHEVISQKSQSEGQKGSSDVSFVREKTFTYTSSGLTPDDVQNPFGPEFDAPGQSFDPYPRPTYSLTYEKVEPDAVDDVIAKAKGMLGGDAKVSVQFHPGGYYTIRVTGTDKNPEHLEEWCVEADWFMHHTVEEWHGVTLVRDQTGKATGFKYKPKVYDSNGEVDWTSTDAQEAITVSFAMIRGDLDANWMGSDPQMPGASSASVATSGGSSSSSSASTDPTVYYTSGIGESAKGTLSPAPSHSDQHGTGWSSADDWTDPDNGTDSQDKERSHVKTKISRRLNSDGTYDITVTRTYPHQRKWEWETRQSNANGDERTIYHVVYKNWASRRDIQNDIIESILKGKGAQTTTQANGNTVTSFADATWDEGWDLSGGVHVNEFGLVDGGPFTLKPNWDSQNRAVRRRAETDTQMDPFRKFDFEFAGKENCPVSAKTGVGNNDSMKTPPLDAADGKWWRVVGISGHNGFSTDKGQANTAFNTGWLSETDAVDDIGRKKADQAGQSFDTWKAEHPNWMEDARSEWNGDGTSQNPGKKNTCYALPGSVAPHPARQGGLNGFAWTRIDVRIHGPWFSCAIPNRLEPDAINDYLKN